MGIKILNATLLLATVIGAILAYRASREYRQTLAAHRELDALTELPIGDPTKVHVRALATGEDLFFSWRLHVPEGVSLRWRENYGQIGMDDVWKRARGVSDCVATVQLCEGFDGGVWLHIGLNEDVTVSSRLGGQDLSSFLADHQDRIQIEQLGCNGVEEVKADEVVPLLRLTLPDELMKEFKERLELSILQQAPGDNVLLLELGTTEAFAKAGARP